MKLDSSIKSCLLILTIVSLDLEKATLHDIINDKKEQRKNKT